MSLFEQLPSLGQRTYKFGDRAALHKDKILRLDCNGTRDTAAVRCLSLGLFRPTRAQLESGFEIAIERKEFRDDESLAFSPLPPTTKYLRPLSTASLGGAKLSVSNCNVRWDNARPLLSSAEFLLRLPRRPEFVSVACLYTEI